jgi:hypothetical protein
VIIGAIDQEAAHAALAHLGEGDLLRAPKVAAIRCAVLWRINVTCPRVVPIELAIKEEEALS